MTCAIPLAAIVAFQRRFRPELIDGEIDGECRAILLQLLLDRERGTPPEELGLSSDDYIGGARGLGGRGSRKRGRGKSGLHGTTVPGNARRGRPQGKCHRKQSASASAEQGRKGGVRAHRASGNGGGTANPTGSKTE